MKSGFVAILGRPNVGKSTILNGILKQKVSIVTDKSQTTRNNIRGIFNRENLQIIFVDTPGIHKPHQKLGQEMNVMAYSAAHDVDVAILVVDASQKFGKGDQFLFEHLDIKKTPLIIVINKIDQATLLEVQELKNIYQDAFPEAYILESSAIDGFNLDTLINKVEELLPEGVPYYDNETLTDKDVIFQIKEIIREKTLRQLRDEVPHSIAIYMDDIDWDSKPIEIKGSIVVEKQSQKGIVIGAGGKRIKSIGMAARKDIEQLLNKHVNLDLIVKVEEDWRNQDKLLKRFGYKVEK